MADLNHVTVFAKVVEAGSFAGAARALGMPRATVSRQVAQLEADLGARLLHRTTRRLTLTAQGSAFHQDVTRGLAYLDAARERLAAEQAEPAGTLRITAPVGFGNHYVMAWIPEFLATHGKVRIELALTDATVDLLADGIDLAFRTGPLGGADLIARRLGPARRGLVASPDYLRARGAPNQLAELAHHDCILFGQALDGAVLHLEGPEGTVSQAVRGRFAVNDAYAALQAARAGLGIALLPRAVAAADLRADQLRRVLPSYGVQGGLHLVYLSNRHIPTALRAFIDFVMSRAGELAT